LCVFVCMTPRADTTALFFSLDPKSMYAKVHIYMHTCLCVQAHVDEQTLEWARHQGVQIYKTTTTLVFAAYIRALQCSCLPHVLAQQTARLLHIYSHAPPAKSMCLGTCIIVLCGSTYIVGKIDCLRCVIAKHVWKQCASMLSHACKCLRAQVCPKNSAI
jgi:hypothetical protein